MPSASSLYFCSKSKYSPPVLKYLSGNDIDKSLGLLGIKPLALEIALPKPPIAECSSTVTINLYFSGYFFTDSKSKGLIVWTFNTEAFKLCFFNISAAFIELETIDPVAKIVISSPSLILIHFPISNL